MEKAKIQLIIGGLLVVALPLVCYLDKRDVDAEKAERAQALEAENRKEEQQKSQWEVEREAKKQKEEEQKKQWARNSERIRMAGTLEAFLKSEWPNGVDVEFNGNFELSHKVEDSVWDIFTFNITGITFQKKENEILINGAIKVRRGDVTTNASNVIISRNPAVFDLLEKFKTAVLEDLVQ